jgi:CheY-like chemotaxis protein
MRVPFPVPRVLSATESPAGDERVLFVDDERGVMESVVLMLKRLGYRVTACLSSIEALTLFKEAPEQYDIVITDHMMPNMTGMELARRLHQHRPGIPVILCSGSSDAAIEAEAGSVGIARFLVKPVLGSDIARAKRKVCGSR